MREFRALSKPWGPRAVVCFAEATLPWNLVSLRVFMRMKSTPLQGAFLLWISVSSPVKEGCSQNLLYRAAGGTSQIKPGQQRIPCNSYPLPFLHEGTLPRQALWGNGFGTETISIQSLLCHLLAVWIQTRHATLCAPVLSSVKWGQNSLSCRDVERL